jgi:hypothetical protein
MTRDEAITLILNRTGQRGGAVSPVDSVLQAQVLVEMKFMQEELERTDSGLMPWFLEQEYTDASFKTAAATTTVALPTGFLRELDEVRVALFYQDTTVSGDQWIPIPKADYDELKEEFGGDSNGKPQGYCLLGENIRLFPTPDAEYPLKLLAYIGDTVLSTNIENKWLKYAGKLLIGKTGFVVAGFGVRDEGATAFFMKMEGEGRDALIKANTARAEAGRGRQQGED